MHLGAHTLREHKHSSQQHGHIPLRAAATDSMREARAAAAPAAAAEGGPGVHLTDPTYPGAHHLRSAYYSKRDRPLCRVV